MRKGWPSWSLDVLDGWRSTDNDECLTLEHSEEGAFQLSSATKKVGLVTAKEIDDFATRQSDGWGASSQVQCGEFAGLVFRYVEGDHHWIRWFLYTGSTLLFATYNGSARALRVETPMVERMLQTLRVEPRGA